jgi:hypothetical protein
MFYHYPEDKDGDNKDVCGYSSWTYPIVGFDRNNYVSPLELVISQPEYQALSYVWGHPETTDVAYVEDVDSRGTQPHCTLGLEQNLSLTLRHLRVPDQAQLCWVDAVCLYVDRY